MSKEELLKYLIAEIDLIMHDKDYRFENANGTWYSRESCRDLTNEEVFEELRTELRQFADLEAKLVESESKRKSLEEKIKFLTEETEENFVDGQKYNQLKHQLAITEKALELACERVKYFEEMQDKEMGFYEFFGYDSDYDLKAIIEQYKQQAKEMLGNE